MGFEDAGSSRGRDPSWGGSGAGQDDGPADALDHRGTHHSRCDQVHAGNNWSHPWDRHLHHRPQGNGARILSTRRE